MKFVVTELVSMKDLRRTYFHHVLTACNGNKTETARILKIDRRTLYRWLGEKQPRLPNL